MLMFSHVLLFFNREPIGKKKTGKSFVCVLAMLVCLFVYSWVKFGEKINKSVCLIYFLFTIPLCTWYNFISI